MNTVHSPPTHGSSGTMDLFGDIDDISSENDEDSPLPIPGQPVVSIATNLNWSPCSELRKHFQRLMVLLSCGEGAWIAERHLKHLMNG